MKGAEVPQKGPVRPVWTMRLEEDEFWSLTATWANRQQLFEDVVMMQAACIHSIRDLQVWRLSLATAAVDVLEQEPEPGCT